MLKASSLKQLVEKGLCTGCGLCESLGGKHQLEMKISKQGFMRPVVKGVLDWGLEKKILQVCPGSQVRAPRTNKLQGVLHRIFGQIESLAKGHAVDSDVRFRAATGGVLTGLAMYLLESGKVEAVLQTAASSDSPLFNENRYNQSRADIIASSGSRYGPAAPLTQVHDYLNRGVVFAFVGKPCDVAALRNLSRVDERVEKQIPFMLTMFCGATPSIHATQNIVRKYKLEPDQVAEFRYRGHGWPGPTYIQSVEGKEFSQSYDETWFSEMTYDLMFRCNLCADGIGENADVVAGDSWVMEDGKPSHNERGDGWNFYIARNKKGKTLLDSAIDAGYITREAFSIGELESMHDDHAYKKRSILWRSLGLSLLGQPSTAYSNLRVFSAGMLNASWRERWEGLVGMIGRVRRGRNLEQI